MKTTGIAYAFSAKVWCSEWYFVTLPQDMSAEIRENFKFLEQGWGRLQATAKIGTTEWKTAIWYDTKHQAYLLPIKKDVRTKAKIVVDDVVQVTLHISP